MAISKKQQKQLTVLVRYYIKKDYAPKGLHAGDIVLYVENSEGKRYYTTLRRNKAHSCTCVGNAEYGKRCYHIKDLALAENARIATRKAAKVAQQEDKPSAQEVASPEFKEVSKITDISTKGALTRNTGFELLKVS